MIFSRPKWCQTGITFRMLRTITPYTRGGRFSGTSTSFCAVWWGSNQPPACQAVSLRRTKGEWAIRLEWQDNQAGAKQAAQEAEPLHECKCWAEGGWTTRVCVGGFGRETGVIKLSYWRWAPTAAPSDLVITARCQPIRHMWFIQSRLHFCFFPWNEDEDREARWSSCTSDKKSTFHFLIDKKKTF